jgi:hypothetical protein
MRLLLSAVGLTLAASLTAQNVAVGFTFNTGISATSRGALQAAAGQLLFRFDAEDYRCWGDANGTTNTVTGMQFILQDQFDSSVEQYDIRIYGEDLTTPNPNFPNFAPTAPVGTNQLAHFGPFSSPGGTLNAPAAWFVTVTFATPLALPDAQDIFLGVELQPSAAANTAATPPSWPNDGISVQIELGLQQPAPFTVWDLKGPAAISGGLTANSYAIAHNPATGVMAYGGARQGQVDFLTTTNVGRGVVTAQTNQTSLTVSNALPGTASFYIGVHPDAATPPFNGGRADVPSYVFMGAPAGTIVFFLIDFSFSPFPLPLSMFVPGSTGAACLNLGAFQTLGFSIASGTGQDAFTLNLSPGARTLIGGLTLVWQGVSLDPVANVLHGGPCGAQHF